MKDYYVTLCHELIGYNIQAVAPDESTLARYLNKVYGGVWSNIVTELPAGEVIGKTLYVKKSYVND